MGIEMNHPTPSHSPNTNAKLSGGHKWSNVVTNGRRTQSPTISGNNSDVILSDDPFSK